MSTHQVTPQSLVEQGLHASVSDDCMVVVRDSTGANLRWANNTLTTNGVMHGMDVSVVSFVRGTGGVQVGTVSGLGRPAGPHRHPRLRRLRTRAR